MTTLIEGVCEEPTTARNLESLFPADREGLLAGLAGKLEHSVCAADQNLGHLEEQLLRGGHEVFRQMLEKAAQQKADAAPPLCARCQNKLSRLSKGHWTSIRARFGLIRVQRAAGVLPKVSQMAFSSRSGAGLA